MDELLGLSCSRGKEIAIALAVVSCSVLFFLWISRRTAVRKSQQLRLPPGPKGWPLIGALPYVGEFPHKSFHELSKKYGPLMYMQLGSMPSLVVSNAAMAKEALQTNDKNFSSRPSLLVPKFLFYGNRDIAFAPHGAHWRQARKVVNLQLLTPIKLAHFMTIIRDEILSTVHTILEQSKSNGEDVSVDVSAVLPGMTMNNITQMMWNKRHCNVKGGETHSDLSLEKHIRAASALIGSNNVADFLPPALKSSALKLTGVDKKVKIVREGFNEFFDTIIHEKEQAFTKEADASAPADEDDFISVLLKIKDKSGVSPEFNREEMQSILMDMILAGSDTTAITLEWTFTELMKHPDIMRKLQDELRAVAGEDRLVNESDIPNLKYLGAVVKETLRLHSPGPLAIPHMSTAACRINGYDIPANTTIFLNIYGLHRDESVWEKPLEFNPDRFLLSDVDYKGRYFDFLPFGSGRRICPGIQFASTMLHCGLAQLLHTITWSLPEGQSSETLDMSEASGIVISRAIPLMLNAKPRLAHHLIYPTGA